MINKYWTLKGNQIGTAHLNRNGEEVDFRPSSLVVVKKEVVEFWPEGHQEVDNLKLPYEIMVLELGDGSSPRMKIKRVKVNFKQTEVESPVNDKWYIKHFGPITAESLAKHENWREVLRQERLVREEENKNYFSKEKLAAKDFFNKVAKVWPSLSRQERKWMKRFIRRGKSSSESFNILWKIDPLGYKGVLRESTDSLLREKLGERLNIQ